MGTGICLENVNTIYNLLEVGEIINGMHHIFFIFIFFISFTSIRMKFNIFAEVLACDCSANYVGDNTFSVLIFSVVKCWPCRIAVVYFLTNARGRLWRMVAFYGGYGRFLAFRHDHPSPTYNTSHFMYFIVCLLFLVNLVDLLTSLLQALFNCRFVSPFHIIYLIEISLCLGKFNCNDL